MDDLINFDFVKDSSHLAPYILGFDFDLNFLIVAIIIISCVFLLLVYIVYLYRN